MDKLTITDVDAEPSRPKRRSDENVFIRNWLSILLVVIALFGKSWDGFGWMFGRESKERELAVEQAQIVAEQVRLSTRMDQLERTYVRSEALTDKMDRVFDRLTSIEKKLSERR